MLASDVRPAPRVLLGRYALHEQIAAGGMASVYLARLLGPVGFSRTVAIKKLHPQYANDPEFTTMFLDEARLAARIRHPNVIQTIDVVSRDGELFHVMEYVHGQTLAQLVRASFRRAERVPSVIAANVMMGALHGLHAAHEATDEKGKPLHIVHRDVSPQNIFVGADGVPRVLDFGVAKAIGRLQSTSQGQLKGKLGYMSPEQVRGKEVSPRTDVFAAAVVLWEVLAGRRLFVADNQPALFLKVLEGRTPDLAEFAPDTSPALIAVVQRGLAKAPRERFATAREMALAVEAAVGLVSAAAIGEWVERIAHDELSVRAKMVTVAEVDTTPPHDAAASPEADDPDTVEDASTPSVAAPAGDEDVDDDVDQLAETIDDRRRREKTTTARTTIKMSQAEHERAAGFVSRDSLSSNDTSAVGVASSLRAPPPPPEPRLGTRWMLGGLVLAIAVGAGAALMMKGAASDGRAEIPPKAAEERKPADPVAATAPTSTPTPTAPEPTSDATANADAPEPSAPTTKDRTTDPRSRPVDDRATDPRSRSVEGASTAGSAPAGNAPSPRAAPKPSHAPTAKPRESLYGMH
jgi:serine/threonine-protein kinase